MLEQGHSVRVNSMAQGENSSSIWEIRDERRGSQHVGVQASQSSRFPEWSLAAAGALGLGVGAGTGGAAQAAAAPPAGAEAKPAP